MVLLTAAACGMLGACAAGQPASGGQPAAAKPRAAAASAEASASVTPVSPTPSPRASALAGDTVVIDPGHDGGNAAAAATIARLVDAGGFRKACDTAGTETGDGYPEYAFTLDVAERAAALLRAAGARVVLTRVDSSGVGPCIDQRAAIGNAAGANAAISIHADGGPAGGYGFHVIEPALAPDGGNTAILAPSATLALAVRAAFAQATEEPYATYIAHDGLVARNDLGGLNLSRVPKVFIECANMRNPVDAARVKDPAWRQRAAEGIARGIERYLEVR